MDPWTQANRPYRYGQEPELMRTVSMKVRLMVSSSLHLRWFNRWFLVYMGHTNLIQGSEWDIIMTNGPRDKLSWLNRLGLSILQFCKTLLGAPGNHHKKQKRNERNKITGMMKNNSLSYLVRNKFIQYFFTIKKMERNEKEKLFLMNGKKNQEC